MRFASASAGWRKQLQYDRAGDTSAVRHKSSATAHLQLRHVQVGVQLLAEQLLHLVEVRGVETRGQHALAGSLQRQGR